MLATVTRSTCQLSYFKKARFENICPSIVLLEYTEYAPQTVPIRIFVKINKCRNVYIDMHAHSKPFQKNK